MGVIGWLREQFGIRSADDFINYRPAENATMLRQRLALLEAHLLACPQPPQGDPKRAIYDDVSAVVSKPEAELCWDDVQRCELLLARIASEEDIAPAIDRHLAILSRSAPDKHAALSGRWEGLQAPGAFDANAARAILVAAMEEVHWRGTQNYMIRKLGVVYAARLVSAFLVTILFGLGLVLWEVYWGNWPLGDARFSGFPLALVAGLLGASFSALTNQRTVTNLNNLEEVRTAIGYPMILLRLGVGVSAAAILYFFFEAGLVEGVLFPSLNSVGFDPVALTAAAAGDGVAPISVEALRQSVAEAQAAASGAADKLAALAQDIDAMSNGGMAAQGASSDIAALSAALEKLDVGLSGAGTSELGHFVPNAALSKLVVWSFLAGFSEKLVPNILGRVEDGAKAEG